MSVRWIASIVTSLAQILKVPDSILGRAANIYINEDRVVPHSLHESSTTTDCNIRPHSSFMTMIRDFSS
jgi:hypothetical protein